jgi:hypothetical protein
MRALDPAVRKTDPPVRYLNRIINTKGFSIGDEVPFSNRKPNNSSKNLTAGELSTARLEDDGFEVVDDEDEERGNGVEPELLFELWLLLLLLELLELLEFVLLFEEWDEDDRKVEEDLEVFNEVEDEDGCDVDEDDEEVDEDEEEEVPLIR